MEYSVLLSLPQSHCFMHVLQKERADEVVPLQPQQFLVLYLLRLLCVLFSLFLFFYIFRLHSSPSPCFFLFLYKSLDSCQQFLKVTMNELENDRSEKVCHNWFSTTWKLSRIYHCNVQNHLLWPFEYSPNPVSLKWEGCFSLENIRQHLRTFLLVTWGGGCYQQLVGRGQVCY